MKWSVTIGCVGAAVK